MGMPKTGSTAIQNALAINRNVLIRREIHYPETATRGNAHHPLAWSAALERKPRDDVPPLTSVLDSLTRELEGSTGVAVLSSEALFHLPSGELRPIIEWSETVSRSVVAVVYVRSPAAFHEGWYRQLVKTSGYSLTFEQHLRSAPVVNVRSRLEMTEDLSGRSRLMVRPYLRAAFANGDVVQDFCSSIGVDCSDMKKIERLDSNPSLDVELVEIKVKLHQLGIEHSHRLANALLEWSATRQHDQRSSSHVSLGMSSLTPPSRIISPS